MNRVILLLCVLFYSSLCHSQNNEGAVLVYDTIYCDAFKVIVRLPKASVKRAQTFHYEEGYFKTYPLVQYPITTFDYLDIHYGTMNKSTFLSEPRDSIIYCHKIGNGGISTKIIYNDICSRQDYYPNLSLTMTYGYYKIEGFLPYGNSAVADKIMEDIQIVKDK